MSNPRLSDREHLDKAMKHAEQLAYHLRVLGLEPQAQLAQEMADTLYQVKVQRAVTDLAQR